jgi:hypothetical protein
MDVVLRVAHDLLRTAFPKILTNVLVLLADRRHSGSVKETRYLSQKLNLEVVHTATLHRQSSESV